MTPSGEDLVEVRLLELPLDVHERAQAQSDGLKREFRLVVEQVRAGEDVDVPRRLLELITQLSAQYGGFTEAVEARIEGALARGEVLLDEVVFTVPPSAAQAAQVLGAALAEADAYCREGKHLLSLAPPQDVLRYRDWYLGEFVSQIDGRPPTPWSRYTG